MPLSLTRRVLSHRIATACICTLSLMRRTRGYSQCCGFLFRLRLLTAHARTHARTHPLTHPPTHPTHTDTRTHARTHTTHTHTHSSKPTHTHTHTQHKRTHTHKHTHQRARTHTISTAATIFVSSLQQATKLPPLCPRPHQETQLICVTKLIPPMLS
jgi:hypothetical protein